MAESTPLSLGTTPFYVTRQYYYAIEEGIVVPDGVDLTFRYLHSPLKDHALLCGDVDATTMSVGKFVLAKTISHTATLPTDPVPLGAETVIHPGCNGIFARHDAAIESPDDLHGKRLGIHDRSFGLVVQKAILERQFGVSISDIEWVVDTHQNLLSKLQAGDIHALDRVGDWYWDLRESEDHVMLYDTAEQWHDLHGYYPAVHLLCVDDEYLAEHRVAVGSLVSALHRSAQYRDEHTDEVLEALIENNAHPATEHVSEQTLPDLERMANTLTMPFELEPVHRQQITDWMEYAVEYGVLDSPVPEERLFAGV